MLTTSQKSSAYGQVSRELGIVQRHVLHEKEQSNYGWAATGQPLVMVTASHSEAGASSLPPPVEVPMTEPGEAVENIAQGVVEPVPTTEQRRFSAPHMEWDATQ